MLKMDGQDQCLNNERISPKIPHGAMWWIVVSPSGTITSHWNSMA
jgi:hypothetical protein